LIIKSTREEVVTLLEYFGAEYSEALVDTLTGQIKQAQEFPRVRLARKDEEILHGVYRVVGTHYGDFTAVVENVYKFIKEIK
jgi:hypothetical protein